MRKLKLSLFLIIPLVLVGCTAFHYLHESKNQERLNIEKLYPKNPELELQLEQADGPQG